MTLKRRPRIVHIVGAAALLSAGLVIGLPPRLAWAGDSAEAEALIRQGVELRAQKKDERALPMFEKAYQVSRSPRTAGQLGLVEMALGYFVDAEKYLGEAVASPDHPWVAKNLATLKAQLATATSQIGQLYIVGEPAGAEVVVNGKSVGRLPLSGPVRLDKGRVDVQVRAAGYLPTSDSVTIVGGKREDRSYRLQREAVAVTPPPPPATAPPAKEMPKPVETTAPPTSVAVVAPPPAADVSASSSPPAATIATPAPAGDHSNLRPVAYGVAVGAGVGLILGAVEGIVAIKKRNEFNDHMGPDPNDPFGNAQITDCNTTAPTPACKGIQDSWSKARTLSIVGFIAGGVLAGGAAALWVISSPKEQAGSSTALACAPDLGSRGLACRLQF
jgi:hypothetical protein